LIPEYLDVRNGNRSFASLAAVRGFSLVPLVLLATTVLAALIPARRASTIDPQQALCQD
jgi:ABC-type lipoprotein release transport system permease subunit